MAWATSEIPAADQTARDLDKPIILGANAIFTALLGASTGGVWSTTGNTTDTSSPASGYHEWRAYDGFCHAGLGTKPSSAQAIWYLSFDLSSSAIAFDVIAIFGTNLANYNQISVQIADNATFSTNLDTPLEFTDGDPYGWGTGPTTNRMVSAKPYLNAKEDQTVTGVEYLRVKFDAGEGTGQPEVTEVWVGQRRQLLWDPLVPIGDRVKSTDRVSTHTRAGLTAGRAVRKNRAERIVTLPSGDSDELDAITGWWSDCDRGARTSLWIEDPGTAPVGYVMTPGERPELNPIAENINRRDTRISLRECAPYVADD